MELIRDARVLREEFVPREVVHRDGETTHLSETLAPVAEGTFAPTAILTGPSGAGKTCIARYVTEQLREEVLDVAVVYCNCWQNYSRFRVLYCILDELGQAVDIHRRSTPHDELLTRLREYDRRQCVVVLDEVDQLEDAAVLYDLHALPTVSLVLIANREEDLFGHLDERVRSRLEGSERVPFGPYDEAVLVDILADRVRWGLREDAVDRDGLARMADAAAGDARVAISLLRNAARHAEREGLDRITPDVIETVQPAARREIRQTNLDTLRPEQRIVYEVIDEAGEIAPGDLYDAYAERSDDPRTRRTIRNYLSKLERYDLIVSEGETTARTYRVAGGANDSAESTIAD